MGECDRCRQIKPVRLYDFKGAARFALYLCWPCFSRLRYKTSPARKNAELVILARERALS